MNMRNVLKRVGAFIIMMIMFVGVYSLGTTQTRIIKEETNKAAVERIKDNIDVLLDIYDSKYNNILDDNIINIHDNIVDMQKVIDYDITEFGLLLYFNDGTGYFISK